MTQPRQNERRSLARTLCVLVPVAILTFFWSSQGFAELDAVQLRLLEQFETPLRWDNVDGRPYWLAGVEPTRHRKAGFHSICLNPGESTSIRIPEFSMVRLVGAEGCLDETAVEVWLDNGSGLGVRQRLAQGDDNRSLLLDPDSADPMLVRIQAPSDASCPINVGLFVSRREYLSDIAPYRETIELCGPTVRVRRVDEPRGMDFHSIDEHHPQSFSVEGPARLAIITRLRYAPLEERLDQTWRIDAMMDGQILRSIEFETTAESRHVETVEGCVSVLGREQTGFLEIPCGKHEVTLDSTASLYVRVLACKSPDYLLPRKNQPKITAEDVRERGFLFDHVTSPWDLTHADLRWFIPLARCESHAVEWAAWRSARDNSFLDGGLQGYLVLREAARQRRDAPQIRRLAEDFRGRHAFYRDLLPATEIPNGSHRNGWFTTRRLLRAGEAFRGVTLSDEHLDDALDNVSGTRFVAVGDSPDQASRYRPAAIRSSSPLRVVVDRSRLNSPALLFVQFDDRSPIVMNVATAPEIAHHELVPTQGDAALTALSSRHTNLRGGTMSGPFAQFRDPAPFVDVCHAEVMLPADVKEIRIWTSDEASLGVSLQCRVARPFKLSESQFLEMCRRAECDLEHTGLASRFTFSRVDSTGMTPSQREIANHILPWQRHLESLADWYKSEVSVEDAEQKTINSQKRLLKRDGPDLSLGNRPEERGIEDDSDAVLQGQPLLQLEQWNKRLALATNDDERRTAMFGRIDALAELGEEFLYERQLRGLLVHSSDEQTRKEAGSKLWHLYHKSHDDNCLIALLATSILKSPTRTFVIELADSFLKKGHPEEALITALMLTPEERPIDIVLAASYELRWWQTFDSHLKFAQEQQIRSLWHGLRQADQGHLDSAAQSLQSGDVTAQELAVHLNRGREVATNAASPDLSMRLAALKDWSQWQADHPGPRIWREEPSLVIGSAGAAIVRAIELDTHATFYRARPERELRLSVVGPLRLKFELRPVHVAGTDSPVSDWIRIRSSSHNQTSSQMWPIAVLDNRPSDGLEITGTPTLAVGTRIEKEVTLGPGRHDVVVSPDTTELLVRIFAERPRTPLPVLPPLTPEIVATVCAGTWSEERTCQCDPSDSQIYLIHPGCCRPEQVDLRLPLMGRPFANHELAMAPESDHLQESSPSPWAQFDEMMSVQETVPTKSTQQRIAEALAKGDWAQALETLSVGDGMPIPALDDNPSDEDIQEQMSMLLFLKNNVPELSSRCTVLGESLRYSFPRAMGVQAIHRRLISGQGWVRQSEFAGSAGVRKVVVKGNPPESPRQRVRAALLTPLVDNEQRIFGNEVLSLRFKNRSAIRVEMTLTAENLDFLPTMPIPVVWEIDGETRLKTTLNPGSSHVEEIRMEAGSHVMRVRLASPVPNQYVRVMLRERADDDGAPYKPVVREIEREWMVATREEPVQFRIEGPAWVRIDRRSVPTDLDQQVGQPGHTIPDKTPESKVHSKYIAITDKHFDFKLKPQEGEPQSLFRVFVRSSKPDEEESAPALIHRDVIPIPAPMIERYRRVHSVPNESIDIVPPSPREAMLRKKQHLELTSSDDEEVPPLVPIPTESASPEEGFTTETSHLHAVDEIFSSLDPSSTPLPVTFEDEYELGGQEDGTWSFGVSYVRRRPLDQGLTSGAQDIFTQFLPSYRYFDEENRNHWQGDLFFRDRDPGNASFGARGQVWHDCERVPISIVSESSFFIQQPGDAVPPARDGTEYSLNWRGEVLQRREINEEWSHTPSATVFLRYLSMKQNNYAQGRVDQDIFTIFRADHLYGAILADTVTYQPTLDTQFFLRPSVFTNEDFNGFDPDHVSLRFGWRQLVGMTDIEATYRLTRFFADQDRANAVTQHLIDADIAHDIWCFERHRGEIGLYVQHDILKQASGFGVSMTLYLDHGRGYYDFVPGDTRFRMQKRLREATHANNILWQLTP